MKMMEGFDIKALSQIPNTQNTASQSNMQIQGLEKCTDTVIMSYSCS